METPCNFYMIRPAVEDLRVERHNFASHTALIVKHHLKYSSVNGLKCQIIQFAGGFTTRGLVADASTAIHVEARQLDGKTLQKIDDIMDFLIVKKGYRTKLKPF